MDDSLRMAFDECLAGLKNEVDGIGNRQLSVRALLQHPFQVDSFEVLHDDERDADLGGRYIDDADDVLVFDTAGGACFAAKPRERFAAQRAGPQKLDGHPLIEFSMARPYDDPRATLAQIAFDRELLVEPSI